VPVTWVRDLLANGDPFVTAILTKGVDVCTVAHLGRKPTAFQKTALQWLSPTCTVVGCNSTENIEYDHRDDWAKTHRTPTDGMDGLCPPDHDLKTHHGWSLVEGTRKRAFVPPGHPDHPTTNTAHRPSCVAPSPSSCFSRPSGAVDARRTEAGRSRPAAGRPQGKS
jgi:hypothetical protein